MQKLAEVSIRRPVFAVMLVLALVVVGAASYFSLGVDRFPAVDLPSGGTHRAKGNHDWRNHRRNHGHPARVRFS